MRPQEHVEDVVNKGRKKTVRSRSSNEDPIGSALTRLHDSIAAEPLPDEFLDLIAEIDRKLAKKDPA